MIHKTPFYLQDAVRKYLLENLSLTSAVHVGLAFEQMELPCVCVYASDGSEFVGGLGKTGTRMTSVGLALQTGINISEEEHWDRWAEIEDAFGYARADMIVRMNAHSQELNFGDMVEQIGFQNSVAENVRITEKRLTFETTIKQGV